MMIERIHLKSLPQKRLSRAIYNIITPLLHAMLTGDVTLG
jgi:hypothetical protein